jgi:hypothetical protein
MNAVVGVARAMKCSQFRREAIEQGCEDLHTKGRCSVEPPKELYVRASDWLCGYRVKSGYKQGCSPTYRSRPLFGKPLCTKWRRQTSRNLPRRSSSRRRSNR